MRFEDMECWIAPWDGDPGRTLVRNNAKLFDTKEKAERFKKKSLKKNNHWDFNLIIEEF